MKGDRRWMLKNLAAAGLVVTGLPLLHAGALPTTAAGSTSLPSTLTTLVGHGELADAFSAGVRAGASVRGGLAGNSRQTLQDLDARTYTELQAMLQDGQATLLVGLLDDAQATLVLDLVRSAGGQVLSVTHHRLAADRPAQQWAAELGRMLASGADLPVGSAQTSGQAYVSLTCVI